MIPTILVPSLAYSQATAQQYETHLSRAKSDMEALEEQCRILEKRREEEMGRLMEQANENRATLEAKIAEVRKYAIHHQFLPLVVCVCC